MNVAEKPRGRFSHTTLGGPDRHESGACQLECSTMPNFRRVIILGLLVCFSLVSRLAMAATTQAISCSRTDVAAAYNNASAGDTILVPPGQCTWTSTLLVTKAVTILGNNGNPYSPAATSTCIAANTTCLKTGSSLKTGLFAVSLTTTARVRVSGFFFDLSPSFTGSQSINYGVQVSGSISQIRIDHNFFQYGKYSLNSDGRIFGVYDHNYFYNDDASIQLIGGSAAQANQSWQDPIVAGSAMGLSTLYIEDNAFVRDEHLVHQTNNHIESGQGGRFVIRYNTFDGHRYCAGIAGSRGTCAAANFTYYPVMTHGNGDYYSVANGLRGHPIVETYNNIVRGYRVDDAFLFRGGSNIAFDNAVTSEVMTTAVITLREEESAGDGSGAFWPKRASADSPGQGWPAEDQIFNSFFWNNKFCARFPCSGVAITNVNVQSTSTNFIKNRRDYFMNPPAASGGIETFSGRPGASSTYPTNPSGPLGNNPSGHTMVFTPSGANAYYPYTPFTYPHPLVGDTTPPPPAPTSLRIVN
jgi:hypothetical protein